MKLNFTIEFPCKEHDNCYNFDLDEDDPNLNYVVDKSTNQVQFKEIKIHGVGEMLSL